MARLFLALSVLFGLARYAIGRLRARRAAVTSAESIPWGVRLAEPLWSRAGNPLAVLTVGAALLAAACAIHQPGVGLGMAGTIVAGGLMVDVIAGRWSPRALVFAADGLNVHLRSCRFVVPWADVAEVEATENGELAELNVLSVRRVLASVEPGDERTRTRATYALYDGTNVTGRLLLPGVLTGADGPTLARALAAAAAGRRASAAN
jgi:hypothetical protein